MTDTATSPRAHPHHHLHHHHHHSHPRSSRPTTTPAARPPSHHPGSVGQAMPPLLSPRTPHTSSIPTVKTPSPNYFGYPQSADSSSYINDSPQHAKANWSPPSSAVRSTAAASPSVIPVDHNPDFDAFRRETEGKSFNLGGWGGGFSMTMPSANASAPKPIPQGHRRTSSHKRGPSVDQMKEYAAQQQSHRKSLDPSTAELGRSPKRVLSPGSMILPEELRRASPASFAHSEPGEQTKNVTLDSQPRFALPLDSLPGSSGSGKPRAETLPLPSSKEETPLMVTAQHVVNLLESRTEQVLLLDLRVQTQYGQSHISGALSLCIPTTLLKRPSFNVQKLAEAFKDEEQRRKFEMWRSCNYIIVYDAGSALLKDATICVNTIKKFKSEGFEGTLYIVKGGFTEFSRRFPSYVEETVDDASDCSRTGVEGDGPEAIPVMGGCPMPSTDKPANPFFGNIRQNMDLIGGVGQIPLSRPNRANDQDFPEWLRIAADEPDQGRRVAAKYEQIERREKKRMEEALSTKVAFSNNSGPNTPRRQQSTPSTPIVHLAGLEKGSKNRYNNIWPFEHTRVKLQNVPSHACDYFNASHIHTAGSRKRYISTQAPIPATFNDFWNVIWQQDVRVIVMLTAEKEGGQVKAHNYWDGKRFGPLVLAQLGERKVSIDLERIRRHHKKDVGGRPAPQQRVSTGLPVTPARSDQQYFPDSSASKKSDEPYVTVRRFTLSHERFPFAPMREITQLHYSQWPDFGAPAHPRHLLGLVEQCDSVVRSTGSFSSGKTDGSAGSENNGERPLLVHCSAGCGRTGTFCTVDSVVDLMRQQKSRRTERLSGSKGKDSRAARAPTPMAIDSPAPITPGGKRKDASQKKKDAGEEGGFFFSSSAPSASSSKKPSDIEDEEAWLDDPSLDLVEKVVEEFRHQRLSMVQSLRQFVLCYESVMEWIVGEAEKGRE